MPLSQPSFLEVPRQKCENSDVMGDRGEEKPRREQGTDWNQNTRLSPPPLSTHVYE